MTFLSRVAEEMLIRNIWEIWLLIKYSLLVVT